VRITIDTAQNGYIITSKEFTEDDSIPYDSYTVIEEAEGVDDACELVAMQSLLYSVMESLGAYNSKHKTHRLTISVEKQDGL
jgi:hypothetical protein